MTAAYSIDVSTRHQVFLNRFAGGTAKEALEYVLRLNREVTGELLSAQSLGEAQSVMAKLRMIDEIIEQVITEMGDALTKKMTGLAESEAEFFTESLNQISRSGVVAKGGPNLLKRFSGRPMQLLAKNGRESLTVQGAIAEFAKKRKKEVRNIIQAGILDGEPLPTIAKNISQVVTKRTAAQAKSLARTVVFHVSNESRDAVYAANSDIIESEEWLSVLDSKTTYTCMDLDGEHFKLGEGPQAPIHWNCRSVRVPILKPQFRMREKGGTRTARGPEGGTRVSAKRTYGGWLKDQPASFQDEALGPQRAKLFRDGGLSVGDFVDENYAPYTLEQLRLSNPIAFERAGI